MTGPASSEQFHDGPTQRFGDVSVGALLRTYRAWLLIVLLPTLLTAFYLFAIAADVYESETDFLVRSAQPAAAVPTGLGQAALSLIGGIGSAPDESVAVNDYLQSHDAVGALQRRIDLVSRFRRPEADYLSRLRDGDPAQETLLRYYRSQVRVTTDGETGVSRIKARAFRPEDALTITKTLLELGEQRVNELNERSYAAALSGARTRLAEAEHGLAGAQISLTKLRQKNGDIDPQATGKAQIGLVADMQGQLASARAQEAALVGSVGANSPQYRAVHARVIALEGQMQAQAGRLTGNQASIAASLGGYQQLDLRQKQKAKIYDAASAALQNAREQAQRQQLFVVRVVEPDLPQKAEYPKRWKTLATVFLGLMLFYGIGQFLVAGVWDHA